MKNWNLKEIKKKDSNKVIWKKGILVAGTANEKTLNQKWGWPVQRTAAKTVWLEESKQEKGVSDDFREMMGARYCRILKDKARILAFTSRQKATGKFPP